MPNEDKVGGTPGGPLSHELRDLSAASAPTNFQSALLQMIEVAGKDPSELRRFVYEVARANLRREAWGRRPALTAVEVKECMLALETAISRVEADSVRAEYSNTCIPDVQIAPTWLESEPVPQLSDMRSLGQENVVTAPSDNNSDLGKPPSEHPVLLELLELCNSYKAPDSTVSLDQESTLSRANPSANAGFRREAEFERPEVDSMPEDLDMQSSYIQDGASSVSDGGSDSRALQKQSKVDLGVVRFQRPQVEIVYPEREDSAAARMRRRAWLWFIAWPTAALAGPAILVAYLAFAGKFAVPTAQPGAQQQKSSEISASAPSGLPLPSNYGVYAISDGVLNELQTLPIKAPDPRVALSAEITIPSQTILPDGNIVFVLFRRELVNTAPQKIVVRVVARVKSATTVSSGKTVKAVLGEIWRIRNTSFDFRVSPLNDSREMVAVRPEVADFVFPAGRYALAFGGLAYDFTVAGPITAPAQCLEAFEALNGPIFSECHSK
jgi:hypothetical protein